ncbi:Peroxidase [Musa troglodytarum]|uniref:Peroxidase n=1 Tax=Musa troglodytarum TaxID=320322 RepID=A0A9E7IFA1_9LILI|nr:Peroxidase [Musa troglodytarum]
MAPSWRSCLTLFFLFLLASASMAQLSPSFYSLTCPTLPDVVRSEMTQAVVEEPRMGASILRLFFHDCFVNGCDASVLLDDTATFTGEKNAGPNANSLRGFDVIDDIKSAVELVCPGTVSCADILAIAARDGVVQFSIPCAHRLGGPSWTVPLGRRDATTASQSAASSNLPSPDFSLSKLISAFSAQGLSARDMTALASSHTIGQARCVNFRSHIYNDANIDADFASQSQQNCPFSGGDDNLAPLDLLTDSEFDNAYYQNLVDFQGLLHSDQELFNSGSQDSLVQQYSTDSSTFFSDFAAAMVKMGNIKPLTGSNGEIRLDCRMVN